MPGLRRNHASSCMCCCINVGAIMLVQVVGTSIAQTTIGVARPRAFTIWGMLQCAWFTAAMPSCELCKHNVKLTDCFIHMLSCPLNCSAEQRSIKQNCPDAALSHPVCYWEGVCKKSSSGFPNVHVTTWPGVKSGPTFGVTIACES